MNILKIKEYAAALVFLAGMMLGMTKMVMLPWMKEYMVAQNHGILYEKYAIWTMVYGEIENRDARQEKNYKMFKSKRDAYLNLMTIDYKKGLIDDPVIE